GRPFEINDATSFLPAYRAIHQRGIYAFAAPQLTSPRILDCGAHLGLATIYWKTLFPSAEITAFEPDPEAFGMLQRNCKIFKLENVDLINAAVWTKDGRSDFWAEGGDSGRLTQIAHVSSAVRIEQVPTVRLLHHLDRQVDLLKLDIEGAEVE